MRVNLEQASKVKMREPTGREGWEGNMHREEIDESTGAPRRGSEDSTLERCFRQRGRSRWTEVAAPTPGKRAVCGTSDGVIVPMRPGNAGRGKDPDFWCASEVGKGR